MAMAGYLNGLGIAASKVGWGDLHSYVCPIASIPGFKPHQNTFGKLIKRSIKGPPSRNIQAFWEMVHDERTQDRSNRFSQHDSLDPVKMPQRKQKKRRLQRALNIFVHKMYEEYPLVQTLSCGMQTWVTLLCNGTHTQQLHPQNGICSTQRNERIPSQNANFKKAETQ